jgi:hypothetical protein
VACYDVVPEFVGPPQRYSIHVVGDGEHKIGFLSGAFKTIFFKIISLVYESKDF